MSDDLDLFNQLSAARDAGEGMVKRGEGPQGSSSSSPGFFSGFGEVGSHAIESMAAGWNSTLAELYKEEGREDLSRYKEAMLKKNIASIEESESKMGTAAHLASGAIQSIPQAVPMVVGGPVTGAARLVGMGAKALTSGGISYGQNLGNVLVDQERFGEGRDLGSARDAAGKMAVADTALSMLPTSAIGSLGGRVAADAAVGATSGAQQTAFTNLASGRDWNEGIVEGAVMGGMAGGAVSGTLNGLNKAMGINWNEYGKNAQNELNIFSRNNTHTPSKALQENYVEYQNFNKDINDKIMNSKVGQELEDNIAAKYNADLDGVPAVAMVRASEILHDNGIKTDLGNFDYEVPSLKGSGGIGHAAELMGATRRQAEDANIVSKNARGGFGTMRGAIDDKLTYASSMKDLQHKGKEIIGEKIAIPHANTKAIDTVIKELEAQNKAKKNSVDVNYIGQLHRLKSVLNDIDSNISEYRSSARVKDFDTLKNDAMTAHALAAELGVLDKLKSVERGIGHFDPIMDAGIIDHLYHQVRAKYDNFSLGHPRPIDEINKPVITTRDFGAMVATGGLYSGVVAGKVLTSPIRAAMSQRKLAKQQKTGSSFIKGVASKLDNAVTEKGRIASLTQADSNVAAAQAQAAATAAKAEADSVKAEADALKAQAKIEAAQAKAEAAQAKAEAEVAAENKSVADQAASDARVAPTREKLASGDLEGAAAAAEAGLQQRRTNTSLAGQTSKPDYFSAEAKAKREEIDAKYEAQEAAQAAREAQEKVNNLRAMAKQAQVAREGTVAPKQVDEDSPEIKIAEEELAIANKEAEIAAENARVIIERNAAAPDMAQQGASINRRKSEEEASRRVAEEEAMSAEQAGLVADAEAQRAARNAARDGLVGKPTVKQVEEVQPEIGTVAEDVVTPTPEPAPVKKKSEPVPTTRPKPKPKRVKKEVKESLAPKEEKVKKPKHVSSQDMSSLPKPRKKQPEPETKKDEPTTQPVEEVKAAAQPEAPKKPRLHSFDLARSVNSAKIADIEDLPVKERQKLPLGTLQALKTHEMKITDSFNDFVELHGHKHNIDNIKTVFSEFTKDEVAKGLKNATINARLRELYVKQAKEALGALDDVPPVKVGDDIPKPKTKDEIAQEKITKEWDTVDELATKYGIKNIDDAIAALGTKRGRPVKAEQIIKKAMALTKAEASKLPTSPAPVTYGKPKAAQELNKLAAELTANITLPEGMTAKDIGKRVFGKELSKLGAMVPEKTMQNAVRKLYDEVDGIIADLEKAAKVDQANLERAMKGKLQAAERKAARSAYNKRTAELKKLGEERNKIIADDKAARRAQAAKDAAEKANREKSDEYKALEKQYNKALAEIDRINSEAKANEDLVKKMSEDLMNKIDEKIDEVSGQVIKALESKTNVTSGDSIVEQILEGNTSNVKGSKGGIDTLIAKAGGFEGVLKSKKDLSPEAKALNKALVAAYKYAAKQKVAYPDNPELWLNKNLYEDIRSAIVGADSTSAYFGRTGKIVRADIFGNDKSREWFTDWQVNEMQADIDANKAKAEADLDLDQTVVKRK